MSERAEFVAWWVGKSREDFAKEVATRSAAGQKRPQIEVGGPGYESPALIAKRQAKQAKPQV